MMHNYMYTYNVHIYTYVHVIYIHKYINIIFILCTDAFVKYYSII